MRRIHYVESGDFSVRFAAYCGMSWPVGPDRQSHGEALATVNSLLARRLETGHPIAEIGPDRWEISEPEDCHLVPDTAGILTIDPYLLRAVECYRCDSIVPIGDECETCRANDEDRDNENNTETA